MFDPLSDDWVPAQSKKRARHSTGGVSVERHPPPSSFKPFQPSIDFEIIEQLPVDEKLNVVIENMSMFGLLKYRVDNLEYTVYLNCEKHEVSDVRLKLIEYKQIDIEVRSRQVNVVISGLEESPGESCIEIDNDLMNKTLNIDSTTFEFSRAIRLGRILRSHAPYLRQYTKPPARNILVLFR
jgi:hypothetical protein